MPAALKLAVVSTLFGLSNVTVPGPLTFDQITDTLLPRGQLSSVTTAFRFAAEGKVTV